MAEAFELAGQSAEQQLLEALTRLQGVAQQYRVQNPGADLKGFRLKPSFKQRQRQARFSLVLPLQQATTAASAVVWSAEEVFFLGISPSPLTFGNDGDPLTIDGIDIDF